MSHPKSNRAAAGRGRDDKPRRLCYDPAKPIWGASKMRKTLRNLVAALLVLAAPAVMPGSAFAHAVVVKAQPALDQQVAAGPLSIRLEFNARIDKERSTLQLTAPDGSKSEIRMDPDGEPNVVTATTGALAPGAYSLRWQVLAIDGHITRGDIPFTVGQ